MEMAWQGGVEVSGKIEDEFNASVELLNMAAVYKVTHGITLPDLKKLCTAYRDGKYLILTDGYIYTVGYSEDDKRWLLDLTMPLTEEQAKNYSDEAMRKEAAHE
jgi:hypothetical protein